MSASTFQSTPVITDGRTRRLVGIAGCPRSFQSTPVITDGRTAAAVEVFATPPLFQSTPVITDGRTFGDALTAYIANLFQSTPVITDGRTSGRPDHGSLLLCFNPRPSSLTGEPLYGVRIKRIAPVSIHARHH